MTRAGQPPDDLYTEVDAARAVYRGLIVVGHRLSVEAGEMVWAVPGASYAYQSSLTHDGRFSVAHAPTQARLLALQRRFQRMKQNQEATAP